MEKQLSKSIEAVFVWAVCLVILLLCGAVFWLLSTAASLPDLAALGFPLLGFIALVPTWYLLNTPMTFASVDPDGEVTFTWRYLTHRKRKVFHASSLAEPTVEKRVDSDNDSHWSVQLVLPDSSVFMIFKKGSWAGSGENEKIRLHCEAIRAEFVETLMRHGSIR